MLPSVQLLGDLRFMCFALFFFFLVVSVGRVDLVPVTPSEEVSSFAYSRKKRRVLWLEYSEKGLSKGPDYERLDHVGKLGLFK